MKVKIEGIEYEVEGYLDGGNTLPIYKGKLYITEDYGDGRIKIEKCIDDEKFEYEDEAEGMME